jgi:nitrite reductase/ring-hydroxylating ferredoxin subunit
MAEHRIPADSLPEGQVGRAGPWTVANRGGEVRAVSSRCRHQLADLSTGSLDKDGCLVCPWHGSRYDLDSGEMVEGPRGFLFYVGRTPGLHPAGQGVRAGADAAAEEHHPDGDALVVE